MSEQVDSITSQAIVADLTMRTSEGLGDLLKNLVTAIDVQARDNRYIRNDQRVLVQVTAEVAPIQEG